MASSVVTQGVNILMFILTMFGFYWFFFGDISVRHDVVYIDQQLGIGGRVTGYNKARGYKIFLDNSPTPYNFDAFASPQFKPDNGLGFYLEQGDSISKLPNSTVLKLKRQGATSEWHLVPAVVARQHER